MGNGFVKAIANGCMPWLA